MANKWTIFVRKYAKKHNMSYASAFNSSKARDAYNKYKGQQEAGGTKVKFRGKSYLVRTNKKVVDLSTNKETDLKYDQEGGVIEKPSNVVRRKTMKKRIP
jgi:hypothetical protein